MYVRQVVTDSIPETTVRQFDWQPVGLRFETEGRERFCRRQNSDGHLMASRPRCDRPCRPAAIFFAAGTRVRQDQAELRVNIRLTHLLQLRRSDGSETRIKPGFEERVVQKCSATSASDCC